MSRDLSNLKHSNNYSIIQIKKAPYLYPNNNIKKCVKRNNYFKLHLNIFGTITFMVGVKLTFSLQINCLSSIMFYYSFLYRYTKLIYYCMCSARIMVIAVCVLLQVTIHGLL